MNTPPPYLRGMVTRITVLEEGVYQSGFCISLLAIIAVNIVMANHGFIMCCFCKYMLLTAPTNMPTAFDS